MRATVHVTLKGAVLDPQGKAVLHALDTLGYDEVRGVRIGRVIELSLDETDEKRARERLEEMCKKLLANTIIEDYRIDLEG